MSPGEAGLTFVWRGVRYVVEVKLGGEESFDSLLRRFNKRVQTDGILAEARRREHFEKPSTKRKKKEAARRRKSAKQSARQSSR